jgi:hypothetical protein
MRRKGLTPLAGPGRMDGFHTGSIPVPYRVQTGKMAESQSVNAGHAAQRMTISSDRM